jgi:hypothetical protein
VVNNFPARPAQLKEFFQNVMEADVEVLSIQPLTGAEDTQVKEFGYGKPVLVEVDTGDRIDKLVLHTVKPGKYGHERRSDRARNIILDFDTFNKLPKHVPAIGMGAISDSGQVVDLTESREFFLVTKLIAGRMYVDDLKHLLDGRDLVPDDHQRALALADYLVMIHAEKNDEPGLYHRCIRDLLGHGEGIMGLIDSYPDNFEISPPSRMQAIEKKLIDWRWSLKNKSERLSQVHGDFHPWNVLFRKDNDFSVLDRSRGQLGEPADDVSAMSINYIFFALQQHGSFRGLFKVLFELFWERYLQNANDIVINSVIQPFFVWRALVLAHPGWYPNIREETRRMLFNFIESVLEEEWFDPEKINRYLGVDG